MTLQLNADIKERICQIANQYNIFHEDCDTSTWTKPKQFARVCVTLTHVDSLWRKVGIRHAWNTVYVDDRLAERVISDIRVVHGQHTRKLWIQVKFKSIASHYRRYVLTHENTDFQPFCDLLKWSQLSDLEIAYTHKCAFPGLAAYLAPRLGNIRRLTITGRVPIDMRRGALLMRSACLEEIHFCAIPREDDSLSSISSPGDPILSLPTAQKIQAITLTSLIDIRIASSVLAKTRQQLAKLELVGLSIAQLMAVGLIRPSTDTHLRPRQQIWKCLVRLTIKPYTIADENIPTCLCLEAAEFPQLMYLAISEYERPAFAISEHPLRISYEGTFAKEWPMLTHIHLPALGNSDILLIAKSLPRLATIRVKSDHMFASECLIDAQGLLQLLASSLPLLTIIFDCYAMPSIVTEDLTNVEIEYPCCIRKDHPARIINAPHISFSEAQALSIRRSCPHLAEFVVKSKENRDLCSTIYCESNLRLLNSSLTIAAPRNIFSDLLSQWTAQ
ncbi:hypothetical protein COEREDRAFT_85525 [Coemansia reversa NRRL 1564]|uniref:Uncharacterized protein n=1 Tax=Coemansia reversa (strain ATCC 12441 / NRRL 1564) TaxID=763665 RepID=A0A2G5BGD4_COERN|nr:hypothetical protein COEREDRAFT_85525 [Coemansia reversa NRRL 1564]|eukprot:PIA18061.1 hypothetical protein COEREDRAFT_85525 [Coemansia reversa NRRL 1564]